MGSIGRRRVLAATGAAVVAIGAAALAQALFQAWGVLNRFELDVSPAHRIPPPTDLRWVNVTADTLDRLGLETTGGLVPRATHARLVRRLRDAGVKVLVFDYDFSRASAGDDELRAAIDEAAPMRVVLGAVPVKTDTSAGRPEYGFGYPTVLPKPFVPEHVEVGALVAWEPDLLLRGVRIVTDDASSPGNPLPHVAVLAALAAEDLSVSDLRMEPDGRAWRAGAMRWPVGPTGEYRTSWSTDSSGFAPIDYADALAGSADALDGTTVIVSSTLDSAREGDVHPTEVGDMQGARFLGEVAHSLRQPASEQPARNPVWLSLTWSAFLALGAFAGASRLRAVPVMVGFGLAAGAAVAAPHAALAGWALRLDTAAPLVAVAVAGFVALAGHGVWNRRLAARYTPAFVKAARKRGGEQVATVLFVDLQGSTQLAVKVGLQQTREIFRSVTEDLSAIVRQAGGEVERTLGDGFMAVFREADLPRHAEVVVGLVPSLHAAALQTGLRLGFDPEDAPRITVGLESGTISGDVVQTGEETWSSFGVTIHTAARLQSECGKLGAAAVIGPGTFARLPAGAPVREAGLLSLKGLGDVPAYVWDSSSEVVPLEKNAVRGA